MIEIYAMVPRLLPYWLLVLLAVTGGGMWLAVYFRCRTGPRLSRYDALIIVAVLFVWAGFDLVLLIFEPNSARSVALSRLARAYDFAAMIYIAARILKQHGCK